MPGSETERKSEQLEPELRDMKIEEVSPGAAGADDHDLSPNPRQSTTPSSDTVLIKSKFESASQSPAKMNKESQSPATSADHEEFMGGEITVKTEPGKAPKLTRTASHKVVARPPPLYDDLPDRTEEAITKFQVIPDCTYVPKHLGETEHALECDCSEEWDSATQINNACGEDSDCINRATKMECIGDCGCGADCQNQRFQRKHYANVSVIQTEKKGYGLRANADLRPNDFIFEYIGEVIGEKAFRNRMHQYDRENIKHFYFMSLSKGEFVDATKRGNLGRFCNHSCNPNCYVDKWVVGDKLRMGIFAERNIKAGEELVFNYNVDRYGADPQPCYCGEPNCSGYIGGKTQSDSKLSNLTIEALGIDDGEGWEEATTKRPRKKKLGEDDEEYVNNVQPKSLEEDGVTKVMASLRQCKEKWIAVKLLGRIQRCYDERVLSRVVRMHGYQILKATLGQWMEDANVTLQILDVLHSLPRITRNKIQDAKIEETVEKLTSNDDNRVKTRAVGLLEIWSKLEVAYRIPRMKRDPKALPVKIDRHDRRMARDKSRSRSKSLEAPKGPAVPSGPRSSLPQRAPGFFNGPRPPYRRPPPQTPLPPGWFAATDVNGKNYYYSSGGQTQWDRPTLAAAQPPPPPKEKTNEQKLQDIIFSITQNSTPQDKPSSASATPTAETPKKESKEKWRSLPEEKQKKIYKNTLHPHVKHYVDKYKNKLPREDLKRLGKEITDKTADSDFKHKRVKDPTKIDSRLVKELRKHIGAFFEKALVKHTRHEKDKAARKTAEKSQKPREQADTRKSTERTTPQGSPRIKDESDVEMAFDEDRDGQSPTDSPRLKRKRREQSPTNASFEEDGASPKKSRFSLSQPPPPPPPPPPADTSVSPVDRGYSNGIDVLDTVNGVPREAVFRTKLSPQAGSTNASPSQLATPPITNNGSCEREHDSEQRQR